MKNISLACLVKYILQFCFGSKQQQIYPVFNERNEQINSAFPGDKLEQNLDKSVRIMYKTLYYHERLGTFHTAAVETWINVCLSALGR
ncbi:hypothetical protein FKM82_016913 [Ascaphus truei]